MGDRLEKYRAKRTPGQTPEPFGGRRTPRPRLFVVQKHAATSLHYDLRLEWQGVLLSWAVPKGPHPDPDKLRLAMRTEDHPVEYADFEGTIPAGNYGAGQVIVWDQGSWVPLEDFEEGLEKGKLLFELKGHKLKGVWTIFRTKRDGKETREWLLRKHKDGYAQEEPDWPETSIFSGLLVEELRDGHAKAAEILSEFEAPEREVEPAVMLARTEEVPFSNKDWIYELKYDGFRLLCSKDKLLYRSGRDATHLYPEVMRSMRKLPYKSVLLDGEICVLDAEGVPEFSRLQSRAQLSRPAEIEVGAVERPVICYVFDILEFEGHDLRGLPLIERKRILQKVLPPVGALRYADHIETVGKQFFEQVRQRGLEGIVAKRAASKYTPGRSDSWLKLRVDRTGDFVIVGWTAPKGGRAGLGALHLAALEGGELAYMGRVGTGFSDKLLVELQKELEPLQVDAAPCTGPIPKTAGNYWTQPARVCEVRFKERTADGLLRHPAFLRMRDDKQPEECDAPEARAAEPPPDLAPAPPQAEEKLFTVSNPTKVFWPDEGYTKSDLIEFYRTVAPTMLPYMRDRPVVMTRYPDGIHGKSFYQKDAPEWVPGWLRTEPVWSEDTQREIDYFVCDDAESLAFLANMGTIPMHIWSSRVTDLAKPDWCILDLDPKGAPFEDVVTIARAIHKLCDRIEFPNYVKTSGSTGLHILLPLAQQVTYEQSRGIGELIARVVEADLRDISTTARAMRKREGKVYLDYGQNAYGQLLVAPFSVRPLPGAPVSTPLRWSEVNAKLELGDYTIRTVPTRLKKLKDDPLAGVLKDKPDLVQILARLAELVE